MDPHPQEALLQTARALQASPDFAEYRRRRQAVEHRIARLVQSELHQFPELARFYVDTVIHGARQLVGRILEDGIRRGEFRPVQHDFAVRAIPSLLVNSAMFQQFFGPYDTKALTDDQVVEGILDLVYHGVLAEPEAPRVGAPS